MTHRPDGFEAIILNADELRAHPSLKALHSMINDAFWAQHREIIGTEPRFRDPEEFISAMGTHGRCCIMFKKKSQNSQPDNKDGIAQDEASSFDETLPVATATLKPFMEHIPGVPQHTDMEENGNHVGLNEAKLQNTTKDDIKEPLNVLSILDWEPSVVAVRPEPALQGLGLASRCLELVERDVLSRMEQAELDAADRGTDEQKHNDLRFLVRTSAGVNVSYWERRGYTIMSKQVYTEGTWKKGEEFVLVTLRKLVPLLRTE